MIRKVIIAIYFTLLAGVVTSLANTIVKEIFINSGELVTVDKIKIPFLAFNNTSIFSTSNVVLDFATSDTLLLTVTNNDSKTHGFAIKNYPFESKTILINTSIIIKVFSKTEKVLIFYDPFDYPTQRYMGLGGMMCIHKNITNKYFYWNLKEHEVAYSKKIANQEPVDWKQYYPDYFTINGLSHPDLQNDATARVVGKVGETIFIAIANTGQSKHAVHFHGFHLRVIYSSTNQIDVNSSKDTFPLESMECLILEMIPDKTGIYSVHDHNLVALSGGGLHPNGMFLMMKID